MYRRGTALALALPPSNTPLLSPMLLASFPLILSVPTAERLLACFLLSHAVCAYCRATACLLASFSLMLSATTDEQLLACFPLLEAVCAYSWTDCLRSFFWLMLSVSTDERLLACFLILNADQG